MSAPRDPVVAISLCLLVISACAPGSQDGLTTTAQPARTAPSLGPTSTPSATPAPTAAVTPTPSLAPIPTIGPLEPSRGPADAEVWLLMYSDFDCDLCAQAAGAIRATLQAHADEVRYTFRPFPLLQVHDKSAQATAALLAAQRQGEYWGMHDLLFERREEWRELPVSDFRGWLLEAVSQLSLDPQQLALDMTDSAVLQAVEDAYVQGLISGLPGVPFLLVNGRPYRADFRRQNLEATVRLATLAAEQIESQPPLIEDRNQPILATMRFDVGDVAVQLYPEAAPQAVSSFLVLVERGWYDGTILHRILPGQLVEGGDPTGTGLGDAGYHFEVEADPTLQFDRPGIVAMANDGPGTNSARFFITLRALPELNGSYTIFGRVTQGLEAFEGLEARDPIPDLLEPPQATLSGVEIRRP